MLARIRTLLGLSNIAVTGVIVGAAVVGSLFWSDQRAIQKREREEKADLYAAHTVASCLQLHVKDPKEIVRSRAPVSQKAEVARVSEKWIIRLSPKGHCDSMTRLQLPEESANSKIFLVRYDFLMKEVFIEQDGTRWYIVGDMPRVLQPGRSRFA